MHMHCAPQAAAVILLYASCRLCWFVCIVVWGILPCNMSLQPIRLWTASLILPMIAWLLPACFTRL
jgi:hypothetical protein